ESGLTKAEIRELSARLGLPTADKPQMACLSSRIPYGEPVTERKLTMIEQAENVLRDLGFRDVRVRHHELVAGSRFQVASPDPRAESPNPATFNVPAASKRSGDGQPATIYHLARIEIGPTEIPRLLETGLSIKVAEALKRL